MNAVDTNVLVYLHDWRDAAKQRKSAALIHSLVDGVLLWQVACEYVAATRKLQSIGVTTDQVWANLHIMQATWSLVVPDWRHLLLAETLMQQKSLSFWDALLIAVAADTGVTTLYSENFTGVGPIQGMNIVNPFLP